MKTAIIMAAGKGTRMHSDLPKVMHKVLSKPMIELLVENAKKAKADKIVTIVGYGHEVVEKYMEGKCEFALQEPQLGTGHAVMQATSCKDIKGQTLVINGDCPNLTPETMNEMYEALNEYKAVVLTVDLDDPGEYGRVIRDNEGHIDRIVEYKDCSESEKQINEINTGIYGFDNELLFSNLDKLQNNNAQKEYYITDLIEIINKQGIKIKAIKTHNVQEVAGVNDKVQLLEANKYLQTKINYEWMKKGVTFINPNDSYIGPDVVLGKDVTIYPNVYIEGKSSVGDGTTIMPGSFIINGIVGKNCTIDSSRITDSEIKDEVKMGPYAHARMNTVIESKNRIGNFVEFKNTKFGFDSRCAHLTYLGDSDVGSKVNIGCGVITVNYDGKNKFHTTIKDGAFIGSNCNLIAPVTVGENCVVAAGTTATKDVEDGDMAIGRVRQENKKGYGTKYKTKG